MKLLVLSSTFPRKNHKFLGIFVKRQVESLANLGVNVEVICPVRIFPPKALLRRPFSKRMWTGWLRLINNSTETHDNTYYISYSSPPYPWFRTFGGLFFLLFNFRKIFSVAIGVDAVFSNFIYESGLVGLFISKKFNIPHYISIHENIHKQYHKAFFWKYLAKYVLSKSDIIFVNSNSTKNIIDTFVPNYTERIKLLPLGVQGKYFQNIDGKQNLQDQVNIVTVSHFVKNKNLDVVIKAIAKYHSKNNINLTLMGDGEEHENLLDIVKDTQSEGYIKFIIHPTQSQIIEVFKTSSIIIQIAGHETFGLAVAEGIASGLFPIVSKSSGIVDDFELHGGFMTKIDNISVDDLHDALDYTINWLKDSPVKAVLYNNQSIIKEQYNWNKSSRYIIKLHKNLLMNKGT